MIKISSKQRKINIVFDTELVDYLWYGIFLIFAFSPLENSKADVVTEPKMILVPEGTINTELVDSFYIGAKEITVKEFEFFVDQTGYKLSKQECVGVLTRKKINWLNPGFKQDKSHPVVCVNWFDAQAYINWLSKTTNNPYRLPTIAEWNLALSYGYDETLDNQYQFTTTCPQNIADSSFGYAYSQAIDNGEAYAPKNMSVTETEEFKERMINVATSPCSDGFSHSAPADMFEADKLGIYGMTGNVLEWAQDCYNSVGKVGTDKTPSGEEVCAPRAIKGSSYANKISENANIKAQMLTTFASAIGTPRSDVGFRLATDREH